MNDIKLVVFDLDGVLLDFCDIHRDSLNDAISKIAGPEFCISNEEHNSNYNGRNTRVKLEMLHTKLGLSRDLFDPIFKMKQIATANTIRSTVHPSEELKKILGYIRSSGIQIACATNSIRTTLDSALEKLEIQSFFDFTLSNEDVELTKPNPEIYLKCHTLAKVSPNETLIFEDSPIGLQAAISSNSWIHCVPTPQSLTLDFVMTPLINIVVPMAGNGSRFSSAGYTDPKPLIPVFGDPMISWVVKNIHIPGCRFIFIIRSDYPDSCRTFLESIAPGCEIIIVDKVTEGAACTVLLSKEIINNDTPLMIANSDQYVEFSADEFVKSFLNNHDELTYSAKISTFDGNYNPKWSYVGLTYGVVTEVVEKKPISIHATTGIYLWRHGHDFVKFAEQMISKNIRVNNEFYVAPVFNEALQSGCMINISECKRMWGLGVPEDLEYFIQNYRYV
jgi:HAD superfamily hydrolase (TIGR01509 family)